MNAALVLMTTAWFAGADAPAAAPAPAAAVAPAPCHASCCDPCCDDCCKEGFLKRLFSRFRRHNDCCDPCCAPVKCAPVVICKPAPCPTPCCDPCCEKPRKRWFKRDCCDPCCEPIKCAPVKCAPIVTCKPVCCDPCCDDCCKEGFLKRLFNRCRKHSCDYCCDPCGHGPAAKHAAEPIGAPKDPAKKMPPGKGEAPMKIGGAISPLELTPVAAPKADLTIDTESKSPFELSRRYGSRVARAPDYSSLTGQLFYVHADGGFWILRYAPLDKEDANGGSVVLAREVSMDNYREGDLVTVHGEVLDRHSSVFLGGPLYRVRQIILVDRNP